MNREDVIRMAHEAGAAEFYPSAQSVKEQNYVVSAGFLERFAALVAAAEREACASVAEWTPCLTTAPDRIATAIRARSKP